MTKRVETLLELLKSKNYKQSRVDNEVVKPEDTVPEPEFMIQYLCGFLEREEPVIFEGDRIGFNRYQKNTLSKFTAWGNFVPDYAMYLSEGFGGIYERLKAAGEAISIAEGGTTTVGENGMVASEIAAAKKQAFISGGMRALEAVFDLCERYREKADGDLKAALANIPYKAPSSYYEALIMLKIIVYTLRIDSISHITLGRFDQYMYPFYQQDIARGMTDEEILELTEEFFINLNFDTDLYFGIQMGDNGQSMMLGGFDRNGKDCFNELSHICMQASMELNLIDPKINLRVSKKTPKEIYRLGTLMTKQGLGFPQYNNDDVVIPGLIKLGYSPEEAYNYSVAACWEYIVVNSIDIANLKTLNFPKVVNDAVHAHLEGCEDFAQFLQAVKKEIDAALEVLIEKANQFRLIPNTYYSLFLRPCVEDCVDYSESGKMHCNIGFHGAGIANAADALAAVKKMVYEEKTVSARELLCALDANFEGYSELRNKLISCPKMGNNDDYVDLLAGEIMEEFSSYLSGRTNAFGGRFRPGTGSAMEYIFSAKKVGATADGRLAYTPYSSSFSPAITTHVDGILSVLQSFTKYDMTKIANGGPLTIEIHDNTFRNDYGIEKVAELVRMFVELNGQQLQLNTINREKLLDAQKHPEDYPNLIVRVWGWSGYFNELDVEYQNHIIKRTEFEL